MDTQDTGPMDEEQVHSKFVDFLSQSNDSDRMAATEKERGVTVDDTEADEVEAVQAEADDAESDESEASEQDQQQPEEPPKFAVKVNGEEVEVTLEDLQKGYMMQSDYSRKTQEIAEARKAFQMEMQEAQQQRQQSMMDLSQRVSQLDQLAKSLTASVDLDQLREYDPSEYLKHKDNLEKIEKAKAEQQQFLQEQQRQYMEQLKAQEQERLVARMPEWLDPEQAKRGAETVRKALVEYGFNEKETATILDHRIIVAFNDLAKAKARIADLESKASTVKQQVERAAPLSKPQANTGTTDAKRAKELRQAMRLGKDGAAAEAFKRFL